MEAVERLSGEFLRDIDRIDPHVKVGNSGRFYVDLRNPEHIGIGFLGYQAMKGLVERVNQLLEQGVLELVGNELKLAQGKNLADAFLLKPEHWFGKR